MFVRVVQAKHIRGGSVLDPTGAKDVNPARAVKLRYLQELAGKGVTVLAQGFDRRLREVCPVNYFKYLSISLNSDVPDERKAS